MGAWLIDSVPAATPTAASPMRISCATFTQLWNPLPHSLLMLRQDTGVGMPFLSATCRAKYAASGDVCCTLPTTTVSTISAGTLPAPSAPRVACTARSVAVMPLSAPPKAPKAVRLPATMKIRDMCSDDACVSAQFSSQEVIHGPVPASSQFIGPKWPDTQPPVPRQTFAAGAFARSSQRQDT